MKKEQAFEDMKNGAIISHISWKDGEFIREIDGITTDKEGNYFYKLAGDVALTRYNDGWFIVRKENNPHSYQAEQLLKQIPLHLEDPNRVWCYSGHEAEPAIAKAIRELHSKVRMHDDYIKALEDYGKRLANEVGRLEKENESLKLNQK